MAKDVITRFKLETTGFDSKIKQAAKGLSDYSKTATQAKEGFNQFTKANVDAAKALGTTATSTTTAKDRVKELVGAYNEAAKAYNQLTREQQQSDFGRAMAGSMQQLQVKIREAKQELYGLDSAMKKVSKGNNTMNQLLGGISGKFGMSASMFTGVGAAVAGVGAAYKAISDNISTAMGFEKSMSQLSSLTGMVGKDLEQLKEYAIDLGSTSTLTASQVADAFRLIGSQQPQLLSSGEALKEVTKYAITLSEAAGIDLQTAAQTLSTSINQMGGDSNNAARYVNVLAAASQKGAGDIAWLGEAITKSATAAKAVGTDYEELVANLEQLAKAGFDASTAGTALRSIIMNLEKQANNEFKPSVVGLTQAFENLGKANLDIVGYQEIAGKMFASQAMALANASQEAKKMTEAITGTNIAESQAKTNTDNLDGALKSLASAWEGLNLHINSSNGLLKAFVDWCTNVIRDLDNMTTSAGRAKKALQELNGGDNGQPSKVDRQINALRGSNFKQQKYNSTLGQYDHDIKVAEYYKKKYKEAGWAGGSVLSYITRRFGVNMRGEEDIDNLINNLKTLREDYKRRAEKLLNPTAEADNGKGKGGVVLDVDADTEKATKSIKELQGEIKKLKKLRDDAASAGDTKLRDQYNAQIKSVQAKIKSMRGTGSTSNSHKVKTEMQINSEQIQKLTQEYIAASAERRQAIQQEIKVLQDRNKEIQNLTNEAQGKTSPTQKLTQQNIADINKSGSILGDDFMKPGTVDYKAPIEAVNLELERLIKLRDQARTPEEWQRLNEAISGLKQGRDDFTNNGGKGRKNEAVEGIKDVAEKIGGIGSSLSSITGGIEQMGLEIPEEITRAIGVLQGMTSILAGISSLITIVTAIQGAKAVPIVGTFLSNGGVIHAASGFRVPGNTYSMDQVPAMLNSGEVVLNRAQAGNIASQLNDGNTRGGYQPSHISGEQIYLAMNRYLMRTGRGEIVTWK